LKYFFLILSLFGIIYSIHPIKKKETDFPAYYLAGQRMIAKNFNVSFTDQTGIAKKKDINPSDSLYQWDPRPFRYTPVIAYIFMPFSFFPYIWGKTLWFGFNFILLLSSFFLIRRHFKDEFFKNEKLTFWFFLALLLLELRPIMLDIQNLQVNFIILFCLTGFLHFRKNRENLAAVLLALAVGFKIFPVFLLVFLLVEKEYRLLGKAILAGACLLVLPILTYRGDLLNEYLTFFKFLNDGRNYPFPASANFAHPNLDSLVVRFLMDRPYHKEFKTNILSLSPQSVFYILLFLKASILIGIVGAHRYLKKLVSKDYQELYYWGVFGLYLNFSLIINPEAFKHGMVAMTIPWVAFGLLWVKNKNLVLKEKIMLGFTVLLLMFTSHAIWGELQRSLLGKIGQDFWGIVLMSLVLIVVTKRVLKSIPTP
jgi:hypothetical protein